jgi:hypothetical protein
MKKSIVVSAMLAFVVSLVLIQCTNEKKREAQDESGNPNSFNAAIRKNADDLFEKGKAVFRAMRYSGQINCNCIKPLLTKSMAVMARG